MTAVLIAALAGAGGNAVPPWRLVVEADPLRSGSLSLEPAEAASPAPGGWELAFGVAQFNLWGGTWHTRAIHEEYGRKGQPIGDDELRELERRYPDGAMYRFDAEGVRGELAATRGLAHGLAVTVRVPWVEIGRPHWDGIAWGIHRALGISQNEREWFPRGQTLLYLHDREGTVTARDQLETSGVGDVALSLGVPAGHLLGGTQRAIVAVELPTGKRGGLLGSGGVDVGVRWYSSWERPTHRLLAAAGYTWLDPRGNLLSLERGDTWHLLAGFEQRVTVRSTLTAVVTLQGSPLVHVSRVEPGEPALALRLGITREVSGDGWVSFEIGEDVPGFGVAPDFSLHLAWGARVRP